MNKKILVLFSIIAFFISSSNIKAASLCSYKEQTELGGKAANIKASYEGITDKVEHHNGEYEYYEVSLLEVSLLNLTDEFYIVATNDKNKETYNFTSKDVTDGVIKFKWYDVFEVANFTFKVYSSEKTNCPDELYKTLYLTLPRYNKYYDLTICHELTDFYLCQEYVTTKEVDEKIFYERLESYQSGKIDGKGEDIEENKTLIDKIISFLIKYKWYVVGGASIIIIAVGGIEIARRKKQREIGL